MSTLLLRFAGPMQSWGADSKYNYRHTNREPTKSGVLGLAAAALGCKRSDKAALERLSKLKFGVRADQEGKVICDFHMVHGKKDKDNNLTYRYYLCDAVFTAGLEGPKEELLQIEEALKHPVFPLFLGRRSCPPTGRLCLGIKDLSLIEALKQEPPLQNKWSKQKNSEQMRIVIDDDNGPKQVQDVPVSFSPLKREYDYRNVSECFFKPIILEDTQHDPMAEL